MHSNEKAEERPDNAGAAASHEHPSALADANAESPVTEPEPFTELENLYAENAALKDKVLRTMAEMENLRRRTEKEVADARTYGAANFARDMLTFADNLARAIENAPKDADGPMKTLVDGVAVIAAHDDDSGVLILSQFAGASRELPEALIVNPYDAEQCAQALALALSMSAEEKRSRMRLMRNIIREFNVYRWAGRMLLDAAAMHQRKRFRDRLETQLPG